ncbi:MAG: amidophosphoribosyltransferase [Clostridia bacterium]|nr:amidophosphoribosyltransferase [Clostridia bacterium]
MLFDLSTMISYPVDQKIENTNLTKFTIPSNNYLNVATTAYYRYDYTGYNTPNNPQFILDLKNTFDKNDNQTLTKLNIAAKKVEEIIFKDITDLIKLNNLTDVSCVCVPRAKRFDFYSKNQLLLQTSISSAISKLSNITNATYAITRHTNTKTTHIKKDVTMYGKNNEPNHNDGENPYPGITKETCNLNHDLIRNKNVILIDDIYTTSANIDEDCIQFLLNNGAKSVILYTIAKTKRSD